MKKFDFNEIVARAKREAAKFKVGRVYYRANMDLEGACGWCDSFDTLQDAEICLRNYWAFMSSHNRTDHIVDMYIEARIDMNSLDVYDLRMLFRDLKKDIISGMKVWNAFREEMDWNFSIDEFLKRKRERYLMYLEEFINRGSAFVYVIKHKHGDRYCYTASLLPEANHDGSLEIDSTYCVDDDTWNDDEFCDYDGEQHTIHTFLQLCEKAYKGCNANERELWTMVIGMMENDNKN